MNTVDEILKKLTLEQKCSLCSGDGLWNTAAIPDTEVVAVEFHDGPCGLRKDNPAKQNENEAPALIINWDGESGYLDTVFESTCYPCPTAIASTWNEELAYQIGTALAIDCRFRNVDLLLGPGLNIIRHPLTGRNFEYFSEDPLIAGKLSAQYIQGLQDNGVAGCVKHFACNNAEFERMGMDSVVEERALREIYLRCFEIAIKESTPEVLMTAYNKVNGVLAPENKVLLGDILRKEWGFDGMVISDWCSIRDRVQALKAGLNLQMPESLLDNRKIYQAVEDGSLPEEILDASCRKIIEFVLKRVAARRADNQERFSEHHDLCRKAAEESIILLKNENDFLPLKAEHHQKIVVIGSMAHDYPRFQGSGCAITNPWKVDTPLEGLQSLAGDACQIEYVQGIPKGDDLDEEMKTAAVSAAKEADVVLLFVGLPEWHEVETRDRANYCLPDNHLAVMEAVLDVQKNTVVILSNGAPVKVTPWIHETPAVIEMWYAGEAYGGALARILFGEVCPSGKLAVTIPERIEDTPGYLLYPGENGRHLYGESIFVGYRYYQAKRIEPAFPFGFGLSYTSFDYSHLEISKDRIAEGESFELTFSLSNTGAMEGKEIVQIYIRPHQSKLKRPLQELKSFTKVSLKPGEKKEVSLRLSSEAFAYWDPDFKDWIIDDGFYDVIVASSSEDFRLVRKIEAISTRKRVNKITRYSYFHNIIENPQLSERFRMLMIEKNYWEEGASEEFMKSLSNNFFVLYEALKQLPNDITEEDIDQIIAHLNAVFDFSSNTSGFSKQKCCESAC